MKNELKLATLWVPVQDVNQAALGPLSLVSLLLSQLMKTVAQRQPISIEFDAQIDR